MTTRSVPFDPAYLYDGITEFKDHDIGETTYIGKEGFAFSRPLSRVILLGQIEFHTTHFRLFNESGNCGNYR